MHSAGYRVRRSAHGEIWIVSGTGVDLGQFHLLTGLPKAASEEVLAATSALPVLDESGFRVGQCCGFCPILYSKHLAV